MDYRRAFIGLQYRGKVQSVRRTYHVLEGEKHFIVVAPRASTGGYFATVPQAALVYLVKRLGGTQSVTTGEALKACSRSKHFGDRFAMLNALYVLVAIGHARISRYSGQSLFFNIYKGVA